MHKKSISLTLLALLLVVLVAFPALGQKTYPDGKILIYSTGQPHFRELFYQPSIHRFAPNVDVETVQMETMHAGVQKIAMDNLAGAYKDMPDVIMLDAVGIMNLVDAGLLLDMTDYWTPIADQFVQGAVLDATIDGRVWALPDAVRPQLLFYNAAIFEKYDIDPAMMATFDGYLEAGRLLKERSNGEVYLSYIDPTTYTWRYWGRRGLMPQANARIWDEKGNVVIGEDEGTKLALGFLDQLHSEGLLYRTTMMQPPLYEATDQGKIATFYIGAFWDEFLRKNLTETVGDWRVMNAPVFTEIGTGGAPVSTYFCVVDKGDDTYVDLFLDMWYDFSTNVEERNAWVTEMERLNGPYSNPVALDVLADPFWQEPSAFYGGQSFRKAEADGLANPSPNMTVTPQDNEADGIISAEIEKYVAGEQTMEQAIKNMDRELKLRIGKADMP